MLSIEIKINEGPLKKYTAVRLESFKGHGATHTYKVEMVVEDTARQRPLGIEVVVNRDKYLVGRVRHRHCAGAVSLAGKVLKLAAREGMDK